LIGITKIIKPTTMNSNTTEQLYQELKEIIKQADDYIESHKPVKATRTGEAERVYQLGKAALTAWEKEKESGGGEVDTVNPFNKLSPAHEYWRRGFEAGKLSTSSPSVNQQQGDGDNPSENRVCPKCKGAGVIPEAGYEIECPKCSGDGSIESPAPQDKQQGWTDDQMADAFYAGRLFNHRPSEYPSFKEWFNQFKASKSETK
jgi:hypothetical protein